jgi:hypothetical protein
MIIIIIIVLFMVYAMLDLFCPLEGHVGPSILSVGNLRFVVVFDLMLTFCS